MEADMCDFAGFGVVGGRTLAPPSPSPLLQAPGHPFQLRFNLRGKQGSEQERTGQDARKSGEEEQAAASKHNREKTPSTSSQQQQHQQHQPVCWASAQRGALQYAQEKHSAREHYRLAR
eukprot:2425121-Rhodomonas_salina.1